jgi:molybdopterin/thiamine biosynthesis adenylyltransferase
MTDTCRVRITRRDYDVLMAHMFPGDMDEHGAVLLGGVSSAATRPVFHVREVHVAQDGTDYVPGRIGYRALHPSFIHRLITRARDQRLAYIAVHNHHSGRHAGFSRIDLDSHELGYPALLQIAKGMPVGAIVVAERSAQCDMWMGDGRRLELDQMTVVGSGVSHLTPTPQLEASADDAFDRQVRLFGRQGQLELSRCRVAIVGLGGIGSLVAEYLARLGVGGFVLIDPDAIESSNLSRVVGATFRDVERRAKKVDIARRVILDANPKAAIEMVADDVAKESVARTLTSVDYLFLAADSMRARLVCNAVVHQYLIPGVQLGSKIRVDAHGRVVDIMAAVRPVRPGFGCLWCNHLVDPALLAVEAKTDEERIAQAYGVAEPNPSVIGLNAVSAAHAVNAFMLDYLGLRTSDAPIHFTHFHFAPHARTDTVQPRRDEHCTECSSNGQRYGRGDTVPLPVIEG